ncbi:DUF6233 domain-containing protein [Streptomyces sioyaensis]|uniref:DUF6233 domain-containing protein n=1 Tax=Streptomyces sioyaensis TaxID=67364 RepID=UPI0037D27C45
MRPITRRAAIEALTAGVEACALCRPERELQIDRAAGPWECTRRLKTEVRRCTPEVPERSVCLLCPWGHLRRGRRAPRSTAP